MFKRKLLHFALWLLSLILSLGITEKSMALSSLHFPFRDLYTWMKSFQSFSYADKAARRSTVQRVFPPALSFCPSWLPLKQAWVPLLATWKPCANFSQLLKAVVYTDRLGQVMPSLFLNINHVRQLCVALPRGSIINGTGFIFFHSCRGKMWNGRRIRP